MQGQMFQGDQKATMRFFKASKKYDFFGKDTWGTWEDRNMSETMQ